MSKTRQPLGQHWLFDRPTLEAVVKAADLTADDTVLEVGPGLGTLTELLVAQAGRVVAVEKDPLLAQALPGRVVAPNLEVVTGDIREYNLTRLPSGYKLAANLPYYLTSNLIRTMLESQNPPTVMALMVQKEVAERIVASPPAMSLLALSVQYYAEPKLIQIVPKELFAPVPQVDSAILQIKRRPQPVFSADPKKLWRIWKAGFGGKRKQLRNSLAAGLALEPIQVAKLLLSVGQNDSARPQELSLSDWQKVYAVLSPVLE
ncbi:ribosomal RNA small subunit methyltransferase A [Candidatus Microgenomates bacterium]|nr:ribosomal RNA small subunit methyltransferase A [Candidatus Microgenomates bacterium]